jgi:hypothetical protein
MLVGIVDEANVLYGNPDHTFPVLKRLRVQVVRVNLYWGGRYGVAKRRPSVATNPNDPAYNWALYDRLVTYAKTYRMKPLFSIIGTPAWENHGAGLRKAPANPEDLRRFASAAAKRYSGTFEDKQGDTLPPVRLWLAWNEPNSPVNLVPQYRRVSGQWVIQSAIDYAKICTAVWSGVHQTKVSGEKVACGATAPRGNNSPRSGRPSVSPLVFLRAVRKAGLRHFDVWAHHPYYGRPSESPTWRPPARDAAIELGNIGVLLAELTKLYGPKHLWITEYGYQTRPPDSEFGVSWALQARYLTQAFAIARRNPRIDMMLWFLLRDDTALGGWQSGLFTSKGRAKPSYNAFRRLPH